MLERLVHFHLFFDQLLFAHPLIIPGTQVTQFRLPDQHEHVLSEAVSAVRCSVPLGTNWKKRIDEDFNSRKDGRK